MMRRRRDTLALQGELDRATKERDTYRRELEVQVKVNVCLLTALDDARRECAAEAERADRLGEYLSGEQYACHHLRRQLDAVQTVHGMSPAEHARVLSDAEHWRQMQAEGAT